MENKTAMAASNLYYVYLRGTVLASQFAVKMNYRRSDVAPDLPDAYSAQNLAQLAHDAFVEKVMPMLSNRVALNHTIVQGHDSPAAFYDLASADVGAIDGQDMPSYTAFGFRQARSNGSFRASTHRVPGVIDDNVNEGVFIYSPIINATLVNTATTFFNSELTGDIDGGATQSFVPVLIRTQFTTGSKQNPPIVVTPIEPPETNDVTAAQFYGLTSQVSRKLLEF